MKKSEVMEIYEDSKTKKQFYVFPRKTDAEWAKGIVAKYRKRNKKLFTAGLCRRENKNGCDEIFPYDIPNKGVELVLVVYQGRYE